MRLTDRERQAQQRAVVEFVLQNPEREGTSSLRTTKARWSFWIVFRHGYALVSMVALLLIGGGTSWAAEKALPGDLLYPIKIGFNENVRIALSLTPVAKAQWLSQQAVRRLSEAEKLANQGRLDQRVKTDLANRFTASVQNANQESARLAVSGKTQTAAELNSHFEATLRAHQKILNELEERRATVPDQKHVNDLITKVDAALEEAEDSRRKTERDVVRGTVPDVKSAAEDTLHTAEHKISEMRTFLQPRLESMNRAAREDTADEISAAQNSIIEGKKKLQEEKYGDAYAEFKKAQRIAQEAKIIVQERDSLGIQSPDNHSKKNADEQESEFDRNDDQKGNTAPTNTNKTIETPKPSMATSTTEFDYRDRGDRKPKIELQLENNEDIQQPDYKIEDRIHIDEEDNQEQP